MTTPFAPAVPEFTFPAWLVTSGVGLPAICSRHGAPAPIGARARLESTPPAAIYLLLLLGAIPYIIVSSIVTKRLQAPLWPICPQCTRERNKRILLGLLSLAFVPVPCVGAGLLSNGANGGSALILPVILLGVLAFAGGVALFWFADPARVARAGLSRDGAYIVVKQAAPEFCRAVGDRLRAYLPPQPVPPAAW